MDSDKNNKINISDIQNKDEDNTHDTYLTNIKNTTDEKIQKRKITITVDEDDPCLKRDRDEKRRAKIVFPGEDPRFVLLEIVFCQ